MDELLNFLDKLKPTELSKVTQLLKLIEEKKNDFVKLNKERKEDTKKGLEYNLKLLQTLPYNIKDNYYRKHQFRKQDFYNTILQLTSLSNYFLELTRLLEISNDENIKNKLQQLSEKINFTIKQIENTHNTHNWIGLDPTEPNCFNSLIEIIRPTDTINYRALALYLVLTKQRLSHLFNRVTIDKITTTQPPFSLVIKQTVINYLKDIPYCTSVVVDEFGTIKDHSFREDLIQYLIKEIIPLINNIISDLTFFWTDQYPIEIENEDDD